MGPLQGMKVIELAGIGPGPYCAMLLADLGADVIRVDRPATPEERDNPNLKYAVLQRSRRSIAVDLKQPAAIELVLKMVESSNALIEGFRPGVTERLGLGPDVCLERNPALVYGRMTGWGQDGPMSHTAGHDINYIALTGALHAIGPKERPVPPLNLVGDFGGGGVFLAFGVCAALVHALQTGEGQVIDTAMTEGAASLAASIYGGYAAGRVVNERESNMLDGGSYFYGTYECADGKFVSVGSIEGKFHDELLQYTGLADAPTRERFQMQDWPTKKAQLAAIFKTKTRDEWDAVLNGSDVCYAPVLDFDEAPLHPHNVARKAFQEIDGVMQPGPAPRFSKTPGEISRPPAGPGKHTDEVLSDFGFDDAEIAALHDAGTVT
jgi:alpha-methylacyl-CoA racemase